MTDFQEQDVRLTAYALGELSPDEAAACEATLTDADREQVAAIRVTVSRLERALSEEPLRAPTLREGDRDAPDQTPPLRLGLAPNPDADREWVNPFRPLPLLVAAALVAGGITAGLMLNEDAREVDLAREIMEDPKPSLDDGRNNAVELVNPRDPEHQANDGVAERAQIIPPQVTLAEPTKPADERSRAEQSQDAQRQLIAFRFNEAIADARHALATNSLTEADTSLQRARTARNVNSFLFEPEEQATFDAMIGALERQLQERHQTVNNNQQRLSQASAEVEASRRDRREQVPAAASDSPSTSPPAAPAEAVAGGFGGSGGLTSSQRSPAAFQAMQHRHADPYGVPGRGGVQPAPVDREDYGHLVEQDFVSPLESPLSTFSVDVDTASYANVRRFLNDGELPPADAVRIEEMVNYFEYDYPKPDGGAGVPFAADVAVVDSPWSGNQLVRIGLQATEPNAAERKGANLVFLVDVSGSMQSPDKLPLVQHGLRTLAAGLDERDSVAIVAYAGTSGVVLPPTNGGETEAITDAIDRLAAGGSTAGAAGITDAYDLARANFRQGGINRVVLATDGDFNVGTSDTGSLVRLVEERAKGGIYLTALGFGRGNLNDHMMETVTNQGDGTYAYVDSEQEADRVLGERLLSTVQTVAKDVKVQVEFNPAAVASYRLIGYANRIMPDRDFADDTKDAGDVGVGHQVTALYEIVPAGDASAEPATDLKYQIPTTRRADADPSELATIKLRWKAPDAPKEQGTSELAEFVVKDGNTSFAEADENTRFAALVAGFGMLLRDSEHAGDLTWPGLVELTAYLDALKLDDHAEPEAARREEFQFLVERAAALAGE